MLRKPCRLQTDGRTDGRTDGQGESSIPPSNFVGRGYNDGLKHHFTSYSITTQREPLTGAEWTETLFDKSENVITIICAFGTVSRHLDLHRLQ